MVGCSRVNNMASRTRTKGARIPATGFSPGTANTVEITATFQSPKYPNYMYSPRVAALTGGYPMFSDNRASITDETGSPGLIHNCTNTQKSVSGELQPCMFTQVNPLPPYGVCKTILSCNALPYYLDTVMGNPHVGVPDGSSVALSRVPSVSKEVMSGLNSLYELKDCSTFLELIPVHFLWAAARGKRSKSVKELDKWLRSVKNIARSPLGILQAVAGADLMWKFGVKPLVSDINNVHSALTNLNSEIEKLLNQRFPIAGKHREEKTDYWLHTNNASNDTHGYYSQKISTLRKTTKTWVYGAVKRIDPAKLPTFDVAKHRALAEKLGLSLDVTDIWEAVPYSFVVDWFLPIQTFLEQFGRAKPDPSWLLTDGAWSSVKTVTDGVTSLAVTPTATTNCAVTESSGLNQAISWSCSDYQRTRLTSVPPSYPTTYIPDVKLPNLWQSITGIELLLQRIKRTMK